jgi:hypothetical protein
MATSGAVFQQPAKALILPGEPGRTRTCRYGFEDKNFRFPNLPKYIEAIVLMLIIDYLFSPYFV